MPSSNSGLRSSFRRSTQDKSNTSGRTARLFADNAGRIVQATDPLGNSTSYAYDALGDLRQISDAMVGVTGFTGACPERSRRDADTNLTSVTDANDGKATYSYDSMDRRASRTDPIGAAETYTYDGNGNLTRFTDRRGKVTTYQYDGLNRRTFAGFGQNGNNYESTINYTWDGGNRLTQANDSLAAMIARAYDGMDNLLRRPLHRGRLAKPTMRQRAALR